MVNMVLAGRFVDRIILLFCALLVPSNTLPSSVVLIVYDTEFAGGSRHDIANETARLCHRMTLR